MAQEPEGPAKLLRELLELEADDSPGAVALAHAWTEKQLEWLSLSEATEAFDLYHHILRLRRVEMAHADLFQKVLRETAELTEIDTERMTFEGQLDLCPTWLAGIQAMGVEITYRGFSILGGETGVGKSKLAVRSALLACTKPTTAAIYLCAELDEPTTALYAKQATDLEPKEVARLFPNFRPIYIPAGCTFDRVVAATLAEIPEDCDRLIVVADTINTLVEKCQEEASDYFRLMRKFGIWMLESRVRTHGKIGWLAVSELNKDQQVLGVKLDKWADFVLRFRRGDLKNQVHIDVLKGRYSGREELGAYHLNWATCSMEKE